MDLGTLAADLEAGMPVEAEGSSVVFKFPYSS